MTDKRKERIGYYKKIARANGYKQETIEMGWMLACTQNAVEKFGSIDEAFEEIIKLCEQHDDGPSFINAVGVLVGIDDK